MTDSQLGMMEMAEEEKDVFFGVINRFIGFFSLEAQRKTTNDTSSEYPFVAMDTRQVYEQLKFVKNYLGMSDEGPDFSLVDLGCGFGNVLLFAEQLSFDVYGIEKDEFTVPLAVRLFGEDKIEQADIRTYPNYERFDVIYYFCPLPNHEPQKKLERNIEDRMKVGAILIANRKKSSEIEDDSRFKRLSDSLPIWQKVSV